MNKRVRALTGVWNQKTQLYALKALTMGCITLDKAAVSGGGDRTRHSSKVEEEMKV